MTLVERLQDYMGKRGTDIADTARLLGVPQKALRGAGKDWQSRFDANRLLNALDRATNLSPVRPYAGAVDKATDSLAALKAAYQNFKRALDRAEVEAAK